MLPTFIIIGAAKTGTTSLWEYLRLHPDVAMYDGKESNFFVEELGWSQGLPWYESLFSSAGAAAAVGEASIAYSAFPEHAGVPERMASIVPGVRLIYVMRDPVARMESLYAWHLADGTETRAIDYAVLSQSHYTDSSRYAMQIEQYLKWFDESQLLLLTTEELHTDRVGTIKRALEFIGVDAAWQPPNSETRFNTREDLRVPKHWWALTGEMLYRTHTMRFVPDVVVRHNRHRVLTRAVEPEECRISPETREKLREVLRPDMERLRRWMGPDFSAWGILDT